MVGFGKRKFSSILPLKQVISIGDNQSKYNLILISIVLIIKSLWANPFSGIRILATFLKQKINKESIIELNINNTLNIVKPDIIHIQWSTHLKVFKNILNLPSFMRPKIIVSLRGRLINVSPYFSTSVAELYLKKFPKVEGFHAVSNSIVTKSLKWGATSTKIKRIYSGLNLNNFDSFQKKDYTTSDQIKILSVGRVNWIKGYQYAIDAIYFLKNKGYNNIQYSIVAKGDVEEIIFHINDLGLSENVKLIPGLPQKEVFKLMMTQDILLLPSVEEGIANVVLEAMAIGLPVVSSDCGGMDEVIQNNSTGLLFKLRNVVDMAAQIEKMLDSSPQVRAALAQAARQKIEQQHSLERFKTEFNQFYNSVL